MSGSSNIALIAAAAIGLASGVQAYDGEQYVTCGLDPNGDNFLALRACGSSKCEMLLKLGPGTFMISLEPVGTKGWREVIVQSDVMDWSYEGPKGWVYEKYICSATS
ncbi:hypothetical protein RXV86_14020 [Alisedimentitalea sp. MJ-SS2]|uniref:hypothetical protein n=1 Tax=Aliisedimentitalea sp. MJ-SS2 TaxID=3049795 RepID=UPI0029076F4D|nr:hypothetical protein [Alisedimentitalea sp. MJ-SS2]MDU8928503.1 hypothetical protein [Alisedimentitalea sp. MJ-SS2]